MRCEGRCARDGGVRSWAAILLERSARRCAGGASAAAEGHAEVSKTSDDAVGVHADVVDADGGLARKPGAQEQGDGLTGPDLSVDGKRDVAEVAADEGLEIGHFDNMRFFGF
jgi:hypothetical protein